jgi:hypothetical protein
MDAEQNILFGHVVAGSTSDGTTYLIPAHKVAEHARRSLNQLSSTEHELRLETILLKEDTGSSLSAAPKQGCGLGQAGAQPLSQQQTTHDQLISVIGRTQATMDTRTTAAASPQEFDPPFVTPPTQHQSQTLAATSDSDYRCPAMYGKRHPDMEIQLEVEVRPYLQLLRSLGEEGGSIDIFMQDDDGVLSEPALRVKEFCYLPSGSSLRSDAEGNTGGRKKSRTAWIDARRLESAGGVEKTYSGALSAAALAEWLARPVRQNASDIHPD